MLARTELKRGGGITALPGFLHASPITGDATTQDRRGFCGVIAGGIILGVVIGGCSDSRTWTEGTCNTVRFRTRLPDQCATAGGTVATATSAPAYLGPIILFSTANVTNANLIALLENEN
jgi:hypothetical protein